MCRPVIVIRPVECDRLNTWIRINRETGVYCPLFRRLLPRLLPRRQIRQFHLGPCPPPLTTNHRIRCHRPHRPLRTLANDRPPYRFTNTFLVATWFDSQSLLKHIVSVDATNTIWPNSIVTTSDFRYHRLLPFNCNSPTCRLTLSSWPIKVCNNFRLIYFHTHRRLHRHRRPSLHHPTPRSHRFRCNSSDLTCDTTCCADCLSAVLTVLNSRCSNCCSTTTCWAINLIRYLPRTNSLRSAHCDCSTSVTIDCVHSTPIFSPDFAI